MKLYAVIILSGLVLGIAAPAAAHHCKGSHAGEPGCDGGGGGGGGGDTQRIPQNCEFLDAPGDTIRSDALGAYQHDVDKVYCSTGDSSENVDTSRLRLKSLARGNISKAIRKADIVIDEGSCTDAAGCAAAPDGVFAAAASIDDMEDVHLKVQAYAGTDGLDLPHIQDLTPDASYEVAFDFNLEGMAERWSFQMLGRVLPADFKQGQKCDLANPADAVSDDVTLYVWPDGDSDGKPDGYTVTTATELDTTVLPPLVVTPAARQATLCSSVDPDGNGCGGPGGSDLCHLISKMDVQFTWHAMNQ